MSRKLMAILASVAAGIALIISLGVVYELPPRFDSSLHKAIGRALAKQVSALVPNGAKVTLITRDTTVFKQPPLDILVGSFKKELRNGGSVLASTHSLQVDPLRPLEAPSGDFFELIRKGSPGSVIVSLMGPPLLTPEQRARLGIIAPKIVAFCPGSLGETIDFRALFDAHLLDAAVISRLAVAAGQTTPDAFDQLYVMITPGNISTIFPSRAGTP